MSIYINIIFFFKTQSKVLVHVGTKVAYKSECRPELQLLFSEEDDDSFVINREIMSLAMFSPATALVSIVLAAFSKAFT